MISSIYKIEIQMEDVKWSVYKFIDKFTYWFRLKSHVGTLFQEVHSTTDNQSSDARDNSCYGHA